MILAQLDQQEILEPEAPVRAAIDDEGLDELAESISELGLLQPILVARRGEKYEVIAGHRRLLATRKLGLPKVQCLVADGESEDSLIGGRVHENIIRRDITPVEEASFYAELMEKYQDVDEVCRICHRSRHVVESRLLLLTGDKDVLSALNQNMINLSVAMELNQEKDNRKRAWFLDYAIRDGATAQTIDRWRRSYDALPLDQVNLESAPAVAPDGKTAVRRGPSCYLCGSDEEQHDMQWVCVHRSCNSVAKRLGWAINPEVSDAERNQQSDNQSQGS